MSTRTVSTVETHEQALHRLAAQAHEKGVALIVEENNAHYVTSASQPGKRHAVTLLSCDCPGFCRYGRCVHHARVLEAYASLPPIDPTPDGGGAALPVPAEDVVVSVVAARAPRRQATIRVENPHVVTKPSPVTRGATVSWFEADGVEVDGRMHGVGDQVVYVLNQGRGRTDVGTIQSIYRTTEHGRWKVVIRETGYGRYVADLRAVRSEEVRHAA